MQGLYGIRNCSPPSCFQWPYLFSLVQLFSKTKIIDYWLPFDLYNLQISTSLTTNPKEPPSSFKHIDPTVFLCLSWLIRNPYMNYSHSHCLNQIHFALDGTTSWYHQAETASDTCSSHYYHRSKHFSSLLPQAWTRFHSITISALSKPTQNISKSIALLNTQLCYI